MKSAVAVTGDGHADARVDAVEGAVAIAVDVALDLGHGDDEGGHLDQVLPDENEQSDAAEDENVDDADVECAEAFAAKSPDVARRPGRMDPLELEQHVSNMCLLESATSW